MHRRNSNSRRPPRAIRASNMAAAASIRRTIHVSANPQSAQWNVTIERQLTAKHRPAAELCGHETHYRLTLTEDLNQIAPSTIPYTTTAASPFVDPRAPYPNWFTLPLQRERRIPKLQALEVGVSRKLSNGLSFEANYALAKKSERCARRRAKRLRQRGGLRAGGLESIRSACGSR